MFFNTFTLNSHYNTTVLPLLFNHFLYDKFPGNVTWQDNESSLFISKKENLGKNSHFFIIQTMLPEWNGGGGEMIDEQSRDSSWAALVQTHNCSSLGHTHLTSHSSILANTERYIFCIMVSFLGASSPVFIHCTSFLFSKSLFIVFVNLFIYCILHLFIYIFTMKMWIFQGLSLYYHLCFLLCISASGSPCWSVGVEFWEGGHRGQAGWIPGCPSHGLAISSHWSLATNQCTYLQWIKLRKTLPNALDLLQFYVK